VGTRAGLEMLRRPRERRKRLWSTREEGGGEGGRFVGGEVTQMLTWDAQEGARGGS